MPSQPTLNKGTLTLLAPNANEATPSSNNTVFAFQYNPDRIIHTFSHLQSSDEATFASATSARTNAPTELFGLTFELDCSDLDLSTQNQKSISYGLHPALAVLEQMTQPQTIGNQTSRPIILFNWGTKRTIAARIENLSVEEKSFDVLLNPISASVSLTLRVLGVADLKDNPGARGVSAKHQNVRAALVEDYRLQTGQGPSVTPGDKSGLGSIATVAGVPRKKRTSG